MKRKRKIVIDSGKIKIVLNLSASEKVKPAKVTSNPPVAESLLSPEDEKIISTFTNCADRLIKELEPYARKHGAVGKTELFPESRVRVLREKFVSGVFNWAVRQMKGNTKRLLEEGTRNYLDHVEVLIANPLRDKPRDRDTFWEAFEKAEIFIPSRPSRRKVHHKEWPTLWREYIKTVDRLQSIEKKKWRNPAARKLTFKAKLPGLTDNEIEELLSLRKASDRAIAYVKFKFKLDVDIEALQKYFRPLRKDPQYGYFDFVLANLTRIKER